MSFKASQTVDKGTVSIDIVKDLNVTVKIPAKESVSEMIYAEKAGKHVTSESSDVSFHSVEEVAKMPSDLEVSGTDEETSVFATDKDDLPRAEASSKMAKLWSQAVAESEHGSVVGKDKPKPYEVNATNKRRYE
jgi:hypothetical protein